MIENATTRLKRLISLPGPERPFIVLVELLPLAGHDPSNIEKFLAAYRAGKESLPDDFVLAGITIPQNPGGASTMSPADVYSLLRMKDLWSGLDVILHVTAKDQNTASLKTDLIGLQKFGLESVLALTGDKPVSGKGVFEVDSIGLIELIKEMNYESFNRAAPGRFDGVHQFFVLAAVSPFKYTEASLIQQYIKMEKKIRAGADALITQMGWDSRKSEELFRYLEARGLKVPVLGNVYLLSTATPAPRLMFEGKLAGCLVTKELFERVSREAPADHLERAAQQVAMYRDLGAAGVDVGGLLDYGQLTAILRRAREIGRDWRQFRPNLDFGVRSQADGRPGYYLYDENGRPRTAGRPRPSMNKKFFDFLHRNLMTTGRRLHPAVKKTFGASRSLRRGKGFLYRSVFSAEKAVKTLLYDCEECGDCFLVENFSLCTLGKCEKGLPNPPCGDANPNGTCAHDPDKRCVGELIYEAAASGGTAGIETLAGRINPKRDPSLEGTSSLLNYFFQKDHARKKNLIQIGENLHASIPRPGAAMKELLASGPGAYENPSGPLDYIVSLIQAQVRHGADYIDVNVDAFGEGNPELRLEMIRDYVRLIRRHGAGIPVCVDSGSPDVLKAGLEEWYRDAPPSVAVPLLNSLKTYTMDEVLPLRGRYPFKFIGLLVESDSAGSEGSYYGINELAEMARKIFRAAREKYGFRPEDIFLDSTVFPLAVDIPMAQNMPGYTYRTFETIRRIKDNPAMKGVHFSLGISNAVKDLPGRKTGVCRAYLAKAREYGLDAAILNVLHDYETKPPAPDLLEFVEAFARQDGSEEASRRVIEAMVQFCKANRKAPASSAPR